MNKIIYKLYCTQDELFFEILHMHEDFRNTDFESDKKFLCRENNISIESIDSIQISRIQGSMATLFLRGRNRASDRCLDYVDIVKLSKTPEQIEAALKNWSVKWSGWDFDKEKFYEKTSFRINHE